MPFADVDHEIEARTGVRIPLIFEYEGEAGFRDREAATLAECAARSPSVLATGGGAVLRAENREVMKRCGTVVYLAVAPELLFQRTRYDKNRPLLQVADPLTKLRSLLEQREPYYREVADLEINSGGGPVSHLVRRLERVLLEKCAD